MKYVIIDVETTGTRPDLGDQIIEFAAVVENSDESIPVEELPTFHCLVKHERYSSTSAYALAINSRAFELLSTGGESSTIDGYLKLSPDQVSREFKYWLLDNFKNQVKGQPFAANQIVFGGINFGKFDLQFCRKLPNWYEEIENTLMARQTLEISSVFIDWSLPKLLSTTEIAKRADIEDFKYSHSAIADVQYAIRMLRKTYPRRIKP